MKSGGWVALGFSFMNTSNDVYHACTTGRENECAKVAIKEYSKFGGGVAGAYLGGAMATASATSICVAIGVPTAGIGTVACGLVVGATFTAAGAWGGLSSLGLLLKKLTT